MKIAFIYDCIYPYVKGGGEKRYYEIAKRLKQNHEIHFFGMKGWPGDDVIEKDGIYYHGVCINNKLYVNNRRSFTQPIYFAWKLWRPLFKEKFDLIECSAFPYFSVLPVWLYSKLKKVPLIITWYEYWGKYWYQYIGWLGIFGRLIEKLIISLSPKIIAISSDTKKKLIKAGVSENNIKIITIGINYKEIINNSVHRNNSDIIFAGRLIKQKNIYWLIKAIKLIKKDIPQIKCVLIGNGPEKQVLEQLAQQLELKENILFLDFLQNENDLYSLLKASKIFVLPSNREGFGIIAIEANACGLPVITLDHPNNATKDLIQDNKNGYTIPYNTEMLANKIIQILTNPEKQKKLSIYSKSYAKTHDWDNIINQLEDYYNKITRIAL